MASQRSLVKHFAKFPGLAFLPFKDNYLFHNNKHIIEDKMDFHQNLIEAEQSTADHFS